MELSYMPINKIITNSLTKVLLKGEFDRFLVQIKMIDISKYLNE